MSTGAKGNRPTRNEQREAARAKAKELREQQVKADKRKKIFLQGGIGLGIIAIATIFILTITAATPEPFVRPANMASDGIVLSGAGMAAVPSEAGADGSEPIATLPTPGSSTVNIVIYQDYQCIACKTFDEAMSAQLETLVEGGAATLEIHPIGMLGRTNAGTSYSQRATAASACVANYSPNSFWNVNQAFFAFQPMDESTSLSDDDLKQIIASQKPENLINIDKCIDDKQFIPWTLAATERALTGPMTEAAAASGAQGVGTPTVVVNGKVYTGPNNDPKAFLAFVTQVAGASAATPTPTPSAG